MKKFLSTIIITLLLILIGYTLYYTNKKQLTPSPYDKVKIAYKKSVPSFPIFVGITQGYFKKYNLEIETIAFESTNQMIEAVVRGDVDASAVGAVEPALAAEAISPGNFKFYGQVKWDKDNFLDYVLIRKDSPINSVADLKGRRVGVAPGGASVTYTKLFLKHFIDPNEVTIEQLDTKLLVQALEAGSVDAVVGNEPLGTIIVTKGIGRVLLERPYTDYVSVLPEITGVGLLSSKFIINKPEVANKFVTAMDEAFEFSNNNPQVVKNILSNCCGVTEDIALQIPHLGTYGGAKAINKEALQKFSDFLYEYEIISKKLETDPLVYQ